MIEIKAALEEYLKFIKGRVEDFEKDVMMLGALTEEQVANIYGQWFFIDNALDTGVGMFGEGVGRLESAINGEE